jgi:cytochrome c556
MNPRSYFPLPLACGALLAGAMAVLGHGGATGIVGERMMGMMMLGEQVELLGPIVEQPTTSDIRTLTTASEMIAMHAGPAMTELFPEGSLDAPSEARPEIWERWQEFSSYATRLGDLGQELAVSAAALNGPAQVTPPSDVKVATLPELSEWDRMNYAWLMGLAPAPVAAVDPLITASVGGPVVAEPALTVRPVREVYADIAATCASCHSAFRR